jgi:broad specificity phosphatase PhoE
MERSMMRVLTVAFAMCAMMVPAVAKGQMVIVVRHAERADGGAGTAATAGTAGAMTTGNDPELSEAGKARAEKLAAMLADAVAIYTTEFRRTKDTAAPLAAKIGVKVEPVTSKDVSAVVAKIKSHTTGAVLVVGHSNTVPQIVKALGGSEIKMADDEYDSVYFVAANGTTTRIKFKP